MTLDEANLTIDYLKEMQEQYIEGEGYERHPLPEWYALDKAIETIEQTTWIPCSERLPEEETAVLISCEDLYLHRLNPCIGWRNGQYWNTFTANGCKQILYPTAWMPLPEPYKGE